MRVVQHRLRHRGHDPFADLDGVAVLLQQATGLDPFPIERGLGRLDAECLRAVVWHLRRKTEQGEKPRLIQTIRGVGYTLRVPGQLPSAVAVVYATATREVDEETGKTILFGLPRNMTSAGITMSYEPFTWGRREAQLREKRHAVEQAENALRDKKATTAPDDDDEDEEEEAEEEEEASPSGAAAGYSAEQLEALKNTALDKFNEIANQFDKMRKAFEKEGYSSKSYVRAQDAISNELLGIRFTAKVVEKLCDTLRGQVDEVRHIEKQILDVAVNKCGMPRAHFIKVFPGHETDMEWLKHEVQSGKPYAAQLMRAAPNILEEQQRLIDLQNRIVQALEQLDGKAFLRDEWRRSGHGGLAARRGGGQRQPPVR